MHRYPYKEEKRHMESIWWALGEHARYFINFLWLAFESKRPFGSEILDELLLETTHNFLQKLFALADEPDLSSYLSSFQEAEENESDEDLPPKSLPKRILRCAHYQLMIDLCISFIYLQRPLSQRTSG
jgi:hypothetical protein